jgi:small-conductance mechanosensitive channel
MSMRISPQYLAILWVLACVPSVRADTGISEFSTPKAIEQRISAVRAEIANLPADADESIRERLRQLEAATSSHLSGTAFLEAAREQVTQAKQQASAWSGFTEKPPYSILLLDEARESLVSHENLQNIARAQLRVLKAEGESLRDALAAHKQGERRAQELAEQAATPEARATAARQAAADGIAARIAAERIGRNQYGVTTMEAKLEAATTLAELANRQIKTIGKNVVFTAAELETLHQKIDRDRQELADLLMRQNREAVPLNPLLTWKIQLLDVHRAFWDARFTAINSRNPAEIREARATIHALRDEVDEWVKISELRLAGSDAETTATDPAELRDAVFAVRKLRRQIGFAISDLDGTNLRDRGTPLIDKLVSGIHTLWDTELYVVEETDIVDGEKVALYRPITIGKLIRLAVILLVGWWILRFLSRRITARLVHKKRVSKPAADQIRKWTFGIGLCLLILHGLHTVRIPLTAFAFLGGALAIGVGFGTQTLLKNFISGIILLFERPLKVGDVVEVENITGTIKQIGMRASVIHHFDGIDTLVPNSMLLENQLTNWTYSNSIIRHSVTIGVAYGSSAREVTRLLLDVAEHHGLVLKDPAVEVRFDDFGSDALVFTLFFWLDSKKIGRFQLASDLRYMIDKAFTENGIVIAFPQRDIHFDADKPLRIELARRPPSRP